MLYVNGYKIDKEGLEKLNRELKRGSEVVKYIIISDKDNVLIYTNDYVENKVTNK